MNINIVSYHMFIYYHHKQAHYNPPSPPHDNKNALLAPANAFTPPINGFESP